jgi:NAD-dependent histone deacetylase SIR2
MEWEEELEALWEETNPDPKAREAENAPLPSRDERLRQEIDRLTADVERTLNLTESYQQRVREKLGEPSESSSVKVDSKAGGESREEGLDHVFPHLARKSR